MIQESSKKLNGMLYTTYKFPAKTSPKFGLAFAACMSKYEGYRIDKINLIYSDPASRIKKTATFQSINAPTSFMKQYWNASIQDITITGKLNGNFVCIIVRWEEDNTISVHIAHSSGFSVRLEKILDIVEEKSKNLLQTIPMSNGKEKRPSAATASASPALEKKAPMAPTPKPAEKTVSAEATGAGKAKKPYEAPKMKAIPEAEMTREQSEAAAAVRNERAKAEMAVPTIPDSKGHEDAEQISDTPIPGQYSSSTIEPELQKFIRTDSETPRMEVVHISPALAEEWLHHNTTNRQLAMKEVDKLVVQIKQGEWEMNHQAIAFFKSGALADGQHRLTAVVKAGVGIDSLVYFGLPEDARHIDMGHKRRESDIMRIGRAENTWIDNKMVAVVNLIQSSFPNIGLQTLGEKEAYLNKYQGVFLNVTQNYKHKGRGMNSAAIHAAMILAIIGGEDESVVLRAGEYLGTGLIGSTPDPYVNTMLLCRQKIIDKSVQRPIDVLYTVATAIKRYGEHRDLKRIFVSKNFPYPVYDITGYVLDNTGSQ